MIRDLICFSCSHAVQVVYGAADLKFCPCCGSTNISVTWASASVANITLNKGVNCQAPVYKLTIETK